jgi:hypothetical protein
MFLLSTGAVWLVLVILRGFNFFFSMLVLPGTILHEISHLVAGWLFYGKPKGFTVWPEMREGFYYRGQVRFTNPQWWNRPFLGLAPLSLFGLVYLIFHYRPAMAPTSEALLWFPLVYLAAVLTFSALPSSADMHIAAENWVWGIIGCAAVIGILGVITIQEARFKMVKVVRAALLEAPGDAKLLWKRL